MQLRKIIVVAITGLSLLGWVAPSTASVPTAAERFRSMFAERARAAGVSPERILSMEATVTIYGQQGVDTIVRPFGEVIAGLGDVPAPLLGEGPLGTPEVVGGNITDFFGGIWFGSDDDADENCATPRVQTSTAIPNTYDTAKLAADAAGVPLINPTPVTLAPLFLTPVPGALSPVIPATSWVLPAYTWFGPTMHITAKYDLGLHGVGTLIGSNVSTASGADPYPVWTPMTGFGFVEDHSLDFVGQGLFLSTHFRYSVLGQTACGAFGALAVSNGVAIFDNHPVVGLDVAMPDIP